MRVVMQPSDPSVTSEFDRLQQKLGPVYAINTPESTTPHVWC